MRAVLDTNVLISSVIAAAVPHDIVVKGSRSEYQIVVSVVTVTVGTHRIMLRELVD